MSDAASSDDRVAAGDGTTAEHAYERLKDMIIGLQLPPGSSIREQSLQDQLGIGRMPLREAMHRLAQEHMLHIYPRRAIVVATLGVAEIRQIFEIRIVLESAAAGMAAERISDRDLQQLKDLGRSLRISRDQTNVDRYLKADQEFHRLIASCAQNVFLEEYVDRLQTLNLWLWNMYFQSHHADDDRLFTHDLIVDMIARHDRDAAAQAMKNHVLSSKEQLLAGL